MTRELIAFHRYTVPQGVVRVAGAGRKNAAIGAPSSTRYAVAASSSYHLFCRQKNNGPPTGPPPVFATTPASPLTADPFYGVADRQCTTSRRPSPTTTYG